MKKTIFLLLFSLSAFLAAAQYSIDWFTIDGGGGISTGGVYAVSGSIGQPDAGRMSGGNFAMDGGFWGIIATNSTMTWSELISSEKQRFYRLQISP